MSHYLIPFLWMNNIPLHGLLVTQAAITKYRLDSLNNRSPFFQLIRLEVQDQGPVRVGLW